jgi:hypothetical protein
MIKPYSSGYFHGNFSSDFVHTAHLTAINPLGSSDRSTPLTVDPQRNNARALLSFKHEA